MVAPDGYTYERSAIEARLRYNRASPVTGEEFEFLDHLLIENRYLRELIARELRDHTPPSPQLAKPSKTLPLKPCGNCRLLYKELRIRDL